MRKLDEEWCEITYEGLEGYSVSSYGRVQNNKSGRIMAQSANQYGVARVGLMNRMTNQQETVTVAKLVADHFVQGKSEPYNTPINLDGDRMNNMADNLVWRPRWFAVKFFAQFDQPDALYRNTIQDEDSLYIYANSRVAAMKHGLLEADILQSILTGAHVFPTWQTFAKI